MRQPSNAAPRVLAGRLAWLAGLAALAGLSACSTPPGAVGGPAAGPAQATGSATAVTATATATAIAPVLAPTGTLRVGVYRGSPTSLVIDAAGQPRGLTLELGQALARELGVPARVVEFERLQLVLDALKAGAVDATITNATPARAREVDFSAPLVALELGLLVGPVPSARVTAVAAMDSPGARIGVAQGSSSQGALSARLKQATVVAAPNLAEARQQLADGRIDAFATNKAILHEMADQLPGARVLPGRWGSEHLAIGIPPGRREALPFLQDFGSRVRANGQLDAAAARAGLRGLMPPEPR